MATDTTCFPAGTAPAPAMIVLPGGSYDHHADHEGEPVARWLNRLGLHAVVLRYRVGPGCFPAALHDAREVLAGLRENGLGMPVDHRVGVIGFSAGGHLGGLLATDTADVTLAEPWTYAGRPDAAILGYPVTDLREWLPGRIPNLFHADVQRLLGPDATPELAAELSVGTRVTAPGEGDPVPPVLVWTTSDDAGVPALHSLELMRSLAVAGVGFEGHVFASGEHGLGLAEGTAPGQWTGLAECWLAELGWV